MKKIKVIVEFGSVPEVVGFARLRHLVAYVANEDDFGIRLGDPPKGLWIALDAEGARPDERRLDKINDEASPSRKHVDAALSDIIGGLEELISLQQDEYGEWRGNLPDNLVNTSLAEKLDMVAEINLDSAFDEVLDLDRERLYILAVDYGTFHPYRSDLPKKPSRVKRWEDASARAIHGFDYIRELVESMDDEDNAPDLSTIEDVIYEADSVELPLGFGRD